MANKCLEQKQWGKIDRNIFDCIGKFIFVIVLNLLFKIENTSRLYSFNFLCHC